MAQSRTRKLDIEIGSEAKGVDKGFDKADKQADAFAKKMGVAGEKAGKAISSGVEKGTDKLDTKLKSAGDKAGKAMATGVEGETEKLSGKLKSLGDKASSKFSEGLKSGSGKVGSAAEGVGETASDAISSGFDPESVVDSLASGFQGLSGKLGPVFGAAGMVAGGALAVGVLQGMETEAATDRIAAQLGGSEWAHDMGDLAARLYLEGFGESVAETGDAVRRVLQNNLLSEDVGEEEIEALTRRFLTFTDVMEQDMDMAVQAVRSMIRSGIAKDGAEALDVLTAGIQQGADKAGDLVETFQEYGTSFREAGIDAADATGLMVQGLNAGARDADKVADAIKEFGIRAQDGSEASAEGFKAIGLNAREMTEAVAAGGPRAREALDKVLDGLQGMEDPVKRNAAAVALFGTQAEDLGDALFALDLDTAAVNLGNVEGATDRLGSAYDNAKTKVEVFKRKALAALTEFVGDKVIPALQEFGEWLTDSAAPALEEAGETLREDLLPPLRDLGDWLMDEVVPALKALGEWILGKAVPALISFVGWLVEHERVLKAVAIAVGVLLIPAFVAWAISAGTAAIATLAAIAPLVLLGAAIALLAYLVITHFDTIKRWISNVFNWVKDNWPLLLAILTGPFALAVWFIAKHWQTIKDGALAAKDWVVEKFGELVDWAKGLPGKLADAASGLWDWVTSGLSNAVRWVWDHIRSLIRAYNSIPMLPDVPVPGQQKQFGGVLPKSHSGELIPGGPGFETARLLQGGEEVLARDDPRNIRNLGSFTPALAAAGGGGGPVTVVVKNYGVMATPADTKRWLEATVSEGIASGRINNRGRRL
jgi:hypothetical protein